MEYDAREWLLDRVLRALCEGEGHGIELERALAAAGVGSEEIEAEFGNEEALLEEVLRHAGDALIDTALSACGEGTWPQRVARGLEALLGELAGNPGRARLVMVSLPAHGPRARKRYHEILERMTTLMAEGRTFAHSSVELPGEIELLAIGAAEAIVFGEVEAGRATQLPLLRPEILFSLLVPFLGPEAATAAMEAAR